jgi:hypothetical protein
MAPFIYENGRHAQDVDHPLTTRASDLAGETLKRTTVESVGGLKRHLQTDDIVP